MLVPEFPGSLLKHHRVMLMYFLTTLKAATGVSLYTSSPTLYQAPVRWSILREGLKAGEGTGRKKSLWTSVKDIAYCSTFLPDTMNSSCGGPCSYEKKTVYHWYFTISVRHTLDFLLTTELMKSRTKTTAFLWLLMHLCSAHKNQTMSASQNFRSRLGKKKKKGKYVSLTLQSTALRN